MTIATLCRWSWPNLPTGILIITQLRHTLAASKRCFDNNGNELTTEKALPCNPNSSQDGPCCGLGDICLSNGLCKPGPDIVNHGWVDTYRSSCTDGTWTVDTCFSGCNSFIGNGLKPCGNNRFCCYNLTGCDCGSTSLFQLDAATFVTTLPVSAMLSTSTTTPASASAEITSTSQSTSSQPTSSSGPKSSTSPAPQPSNHSVAIGAGVGAGIGVPLLVAVGVLAWYLHRRQKSHKAVVNDGDAYTTQEPKGSAHVQYQQVPPANGLVVERRHEMDAFNAHEIDGTVKGTRRA